MGEILIRHWQSPIGEMTIGSIGEELCISDWTCNLRRTAVDVCICRDLKSEYKDGTSPTVEQAIRELEEYFAGTRRVFDVPVRIIGTDFQHIVRSELMNIPYGSTISYAELAKRIGNPKAVRAVANAIATNPLSIFVPCHRVIGSGGSLTGYAGGLAAKLSLLSLEHHYTGR